MLKFFGSLIPLLAFALSANALSSQFSNSGAFGGTVNDISIADTLDCVAPNAQSASRTRLAVGGGYGFCTATACNDGFDLVNGVCLAPPTAKWFSTDQSLEDGATVFIRASLNRPFRDGLVHTIPVTNAGTTIQGVDFTSTMQLTFQPGATLSDSMSVKALTKSSYFQDQVISLALPQIGSSVPQLNLTILSSKLAPNITGTLTTTSKAIPGSVVSMHVDFGSAYLSRIFPAVLSMKIQGNQADPTAQTTIKTIVPRNTSFADFTFPISASAAIGNSITISILNSGIVGTFTTPVVTDGPIVSIYYQSTFRGTVYNYIASDGNNVFATNINTKQVDKISSAGAAPYHSVVGTTTSDILSGVGYDSTTNKLFATQSAAALPKNASKIYALTSTTATVATPSVIFTDLIKKMAVGPGVVATLTSTQKVLFYTTSPTALTLDWSTTVNGLGNSAGIAVDPYTLDGWAYVVSNDGKGAVTAVRCSTGCVSQPLFSIDPNGNTFLSAIAVWNKAIFVALPNSNQVLKFTYNPSTTGFDQTVVADNTKNQLVSPQGLAFDPQGNLYIAGAVLPTIGNIPFSTIFKVVFP